MLNFRLVAAAPLSGDLLKQPLLAILP